MPPIRLRYPKGIATIDVEFDNSDFSVQDLQQKIFSATEILPSRQILKTGYPPRSLTLIPELPLSSLGLERGDQIIVSDLGGGGKASSISAQAPGLPLVAPNPELKPPQASVPSGPDYVEIEGSFLIHRVVPDDNSCLFSSIALIFEQNISKAPRIRKLVAEGIKKNPHQYDEVILGMPPEKYIETISKPSSWGGAIELAILAAHYDTEIASIDVETGRIDRFTPPDHESLKTSMITNRCIVIYSGIHYDAVSLAPTVDAPADWHQTLFEIRSSDDSDPILLAAKKLTDALRAKRAFTNTATFDIKCEQCGKGLKGEKEARAHAEQTGHVRFGEY